MSIKTEYSTPLNQENIGRLSKGPSITAENLIALKALASSLPIHKQKKILNDMSGVHTSNMRGRGVDFSEVRSYQPGDDIRSMDWRVTARSGKAHIKVFKEERERPIILVGDLRPSMFFGTRHAFKSVLCADLVSLFAWSACDHGDRVGALLFNDQKEIDLRPKNGRKHILNLLHQLCQFTPTSPSLETDNAQRFTQICRHVRRISKPGSMIYFCSDFLGFNEESEHQLYELQRRNDVIAIHIYDPIEKSIDIPGYYPITDGHKTVLLDQLSKSQRQQHKQSFDQFVAYIQDRTQRLGIPYLSLSADSDVINNLNAGLGLASSSIHHRSR
jgi:uncharacterized protein (DUF58 family)